MSVAKPQTIHTMAKKLETVFYVDTNGDRAFSNQFTNFVEIAKTQPNPILVSINIFGESPDILRLIAYSEKQYAEAQIIINFIFLVIEVAGGDVFNVWKNGLANTAETLNNTLGGGYNVNYISDVIGQFIKKVIIKDLEKNHQGITSNMDARQAQLTSIKAELESTIAEFDVKWPAKILWHEKYHKAKEILAHLNRMILTLSNPTTAIIRWRKFDTFIEADTITTYSYSDSIQLLREHIAYYKNFITELREINAFTDNFTNTL